MATNLTADIEFRVVKLAAQGVQGSAYLYTRPLRRAVVICASLHPRDILSVLNSDIAVSAGETIEIIAARLASVPGTEGALVLS